VGIKHERRAVLLSRRLLRADRDRDHDRVVDAKDREGRDPQLIR
jgi:hypothetical protein